MSENPHNPRPLPQPHPQPQPQPQPHSQPHPSPSRPHASVAHTPLGRPPNTPADSTSRGQIQVDVLPSFLPDQSDPIEGEFVFGYRVRITNHSDRIIQILARRWTIIDAHAKARHVEGEGVVGRQPILGPSQFFQYESFCPIKTKWGTMEGSYTIRARETSVTGESASSILDTEWPETLEVKVARFYLVVPQEDSVEATNPEPAE